MFHPAAKPGAGAKTRLTFNAKRTRAAPRLRQSLAALGSGYGLNEEPALRAKQKTGSLSRYSPPPHTGSSTPSSTSMLTPCSKNRTAKSNRVFPSRRSTRPS